MSIMPISSTMELSYGFFDFHTTFPLSTADFWQKSEKSKESKIWDPQYFLAAREDLTGNSTGNSLSSYDAEVKIPHSVYVNLSEGIYESGEIVDGEDFFLDLLKEQCGAYIVNSMITELYTFATAQKKRNLAYNVTLLYSHLPIDKLGSTAMLQAMGMTRSPYREVQENAIRCFENWEDKEAVQFLRECHFDETWLQDYANEVCEYLNSEGTDVLSKKNNPWKMDEERQASRHYTREYTSRRNYSGTENIGRRAFRMAI